MPKHIINEMQKRKRKAWTEEEVKQANQLHRDGYNLHEIGSMLDRSYESVSVKIARTHHAVPTSSMPVWDKPLQGTNDAVILSDVEAPFQHSEFINRVLDLADAWNIPDLHLAGDLLHYDTLSAWGSEWTEGQEDIRDTLEQILQMVDKKKREAGVKLLEEKGLFTDGSYSDEMKQARKVFKNFDRFKNIYVALGNHDDRYLRTLNKAVEAKELLFQLNVHEDDRWKIAPYYYTLIHTDKGLFRITHPRGAGKQTAVDLAIQFHQHVIMGHSHRWNISRDPSADYWAIQTGHCVDETRLAYVMQRDAKRDAHMNGATIIRGGYPFVLHNDSPWDLLRRM